MSAESDPDAAAEKARQALQAARDQLAKQPADDLGMWWHRHETGAVVTHLIRRDGTWAIYGVGEDGVELVHQGTRT